MSRIHVLTAAFATLTAVMVTTSAYADAKSKMCATRLDSCHSKCGGSLNRPCAQVCTIIWEDCISHGGWSIKPSNITIAPSQR